ncbi:hypothetical protein KSF_089370 [Reticulibacter mediterranei]|uniref:TIR domain-containing protein n=1 Tax=Reticulibacter mediterranei TaxID=2778369 RepID=A0A8J3N5A8_9CHLR|nr:toll/interleukin-1 receptor domain-containing protein [Reticulibacter mediterranei]GHO98889.1 hypothetical protein KSF_089370 [Reticulibacter mediterranei]
MADHQHLQRLQKSVQEWNKWRRQHPEIVPDLSHANLIDANLIDANLIDTLLNSSDLSRANLSHATLSRANLSDADLINTNFSDAILLKAHLINTNLSRANLSYATLNGVHLNGANLSGTDFAGADLTGADLTSTDLSAANLAGAHLNGANLADAYLNSTSFGDRDFREINGLKTVRHRGPSPLSINSLYLSEGDIPESFVRGTGASESFIEYMRALAAKPIDYYTCFISYSSKDQNFVERLHADLQHEGVRCWYAPEDLKIGDPFRKRIDESIRVHDKLLLVLSEHSVNSAWVEKEVETAFEKEHRSHKLVLFPIKLDETVMHTDQAWAADIRRMRHIGNMSQWKDHDAYQRGLQRLLRDLKQERM